MAMVPTPKVPPGGALVELLAAGICGSDLDKLLHQKSAPGTVLGHEIVGRIVALSETYQPASPENAYHVGDRVVAAHHVPCGQCEYCTNQAESMCRGFKTSNFAPGGFSNIVALSADHLAQTTFPVPESVGNAEAVCVEPLACVLKAIQRGEYLRSSHLPRPINSVAVIGLGFIGLMAAQCYQQLDYRVFGIDLLPTRLKFAKAKGFIQAGLALQQENPLISSTETAADALSNTLTHFVPLGKVDCVFLSVLNQASLTLALDCVRDGGRIILFSGGPPDQVQLDPNSLYFREISIIPSYSPDLASLRRSAEMIFQKNIQVKELISHQVAFEEIQQGMQLYQSGEAMKVLVTCQEQPVETLTPTVRWV
jgi:L-iditol 2-dehydrogenase